MNKWKKVKPARALVCLLMCFMLLGVWALAEGAPVADGGYMPQEVTDPEAVATAVEEASQQGADPEINILDGLKSIVKSTGFATGEVRQYIMIAVACVLLYLAIVKGFEPLLLLPIAFGMLLANLPAAGLTSYTGPSYKFYDSLQDAVVAAKRLGKETSDIIWRYDEATGMMKYSL